MPSWVPFELVLETLKLSEYRFVRIWQPYRVFTRKGRLPILVRVEDGCVDADDYAKILEILRREDEQTG